MKRSRNVAGRAQSRPRFKRGARVTWHNGTRNLVGTVRDVHKLGGHGIAYEVIADGETLPDEVTEGALREVAPLDDPALRELLTRLADVAPEGPASLVELRAVWLRAGTPGLIR